MIMKIRIAVREKTGKNFRIEERRRVEEMSERDCERMARECEKIIGDNIVAKSKNPTGYLASFFFADKIPGGYGNGNIAELDSDCKYWAHLNFGSEDFGANWSHWLPKGRWVDGRWVIDEAGYYAKPKTAIPAMNYIENTLTMMDSIIPQILGRK